MVPPQFLKVSPEQIAMRINLYNSVIIKKSLHWGFSNRVHGINITATIEKELASIMGSR